MMRLRMSRSADTRAPSANELFATNSYATETGGESEESSPWRFSNQTDGNAFQESQDRFIVIQAGNASLSPERSITETFGIVFQPAEQIPGLQVSIDYYSTKIEAGIRQVDFGDTLSLCAAEIGEDIWMGEEGSLVPISPVPQVPVGQQSFCPNLQFGAPDGDPTGGGIDPLVDPAGYDAALGQSIIRAGSTSGIGLFGAAGPDVEDEFGNDLDRDIPNPFFEFTNIISIAESTINEEDFLSRGIDYSVSYFTQLGGGGSINGRALFTRFLEQSVFLSNTFGNWNVAGQNGGNQIATYFGSFAVNYSPTPKIRGNLFMTYSKNAFSLTAQARYTGTGKLNLQNGWLAPGDSHTYQRYRGGVPSSATTPAGCPEGCAVTVEYADDIIRTVDNNDIPSWTTLNLNFNYDFGRSRFLLEQFESLNVYLNIENVGDRIPTFFSGIGAGGINTSLYSGFGRSYRMGVRMEF